jgi:uncharacterized membrane protein
MQVLKKINNYLHANKKVFAKGICKEKIFFIFLFGCLFGCVYEEILNMIFAYQAGDPVAWVTRRGLIYGELSPIYGWGAAIMVCLLMNKKRKWWQYLLYGGIIGDIFEYLISFLQETFTGSVSWDYSNEFLNINGRTTIPYILVWGLCSLLLVYVFYPLISHFVEKIPYNLGIIIYYILLVLVVIDMFISFGAMIRFGLRHQGHQSVTILGRFFDHYYPDGRLAKAYTNLVCK